MFKKFDQEEQAALRALGFNIEDNGEVANIRSGVRDVTAPNMAMMKLTIPEMRDTSRA